MQLSKRMIAICHMVTEGKQVVDVGTDHGYVPICLVKTGKIPGAIAMDVNPGPLERARAHIAEQKLEGYIEARLSDGLAALGAGEGECLIIAGMGGRLTCEILQAGREKLPSFQELILAPHAEAEKVRRFACGLGYHIAQEALVSEGGKYYPVFKLEPGAAECGDPLFFAYGEQLLRERDPVLREYLQKERRELQQLREALRGQQSPGARGRLAEVERQLEENGRAFGFFAGEKSTSYQPFP